MTFQDQLELAPAVRRSGSATRSAASRQTRIGVALAMSVIGGWMALHLFGVFLFRPAGWSWALAPVMVAVQSWLSVGLFIVAHDAIHGSLVVGQPRLNTGIGRLAVALYNPGFAYPQLRRSHREHHRAPGTAEDPDFHPGRPRAFFAWFLRFFLTHFGWTEFARLTAALAVYLFVLRVRPLNMALFWGAPALVSAVQLFYFGTWLPHRHHDGAFADEHRARSLAFGWAGSLLSCFHFGYHLEHHHSPGTPWWGLPRYRALQRGTGAAGRPA